jgi:hypothetical protein
MGALEGLVNAGASMEKSPESDIYLPFAFVNVDGADRMVNFSPLREVDQIHAKNIASSEAFGGKTDFSQKEEEPDFSLFKEEAAREAREAGAAEQCDKQ